jgi:hypothetical protein
MTTESDRLRARVEYAFRDIHAVLDDFDALPPAWSIFPPRHQHARNSEPTFI